MKSVAALCLVVFCVTAVQAKVTSTRESVGGFTIVTKIDDITDTPIMHVPLITKEVRMEWRSMDRRVLFFLRDDGTILTGGFELSKPDRNDPICASYGGGLYSYDSRPPISRQWLGHNGEPVKHLAAICSRAINAQQVAEYGAEFDRAEPDFASALEAMKTAAKQQFGNWQHRCIRFARRSGPDAPCARYSDGTK